MKNRFLMAAIIALTSVGALSGCSKEEKVQLNNIYIAKYVIKQETTYKDQDGKEVTETKDNQYYEQLELFNNGSYALTQVNPSDMTNYIYFLEGTYTLGTRNADFDGYTKIALSDATHVQVNNDIYNGMFSLSIDSDKSTFPHELAGGAKINSKEEFLSQYGKPGNRYIYNVDNVTDTKAENRMCIEADVKVIE
mgnify:CR=1 FL=1